MKSQPTTDSFHSSRSPDNNFTEKSLSKNIDFLTKLREGYSGQANFSSELETMTKTQLK